MYHRFDGFYRKMKRMFVMYYLPSKVSILNIHPLLYRFIHPSSISQPDFFPGAMYVGFRDISQTEAEHDEEVVAF